MSDQSPALTRWVAIGEAHRQSPQPDSIVAFAIDSPRRGDRFLGQGIEINGWVIARYATVLGVRTITDGRAGTLHPLTVRRPDVAADHPGIAHAGNSGFSFWAPIDAAEGAWHVAVEALVGDGAVARLAELSGTAGIEKRVAPPGARLVTAPDFVIIGAQRGGTTSLHAYLGAHSRIQTAATKEMQFVTDRFERGRDWYLGQFPADLPSGTLTGEATPYALFHPLAPARLFATAPEARLIALLRNPIDRAYSHYLLERSRGDEPLAFAAALDAEDERLAGEEAAMLGDPTYRSESHKHFSYTARGDYAMQLERWFARFPREQILVLRSEDLYARPASTVARVAGFLGIPPEIDTLFPAHNRTAGPPLEPALRDRLRAHFAPRNARLAELLGWDPGWL